MRPVSSSTRKGTSSSSSTTVRQRSLETQGTKAQFDRSRQRLRCFSSTSSSYAQTSSFEIGETSGSSTGTAVPLTSAVPMARDWTARVGVSRNSCHWRKRVNPW